MLIIAVAVSAGAPAPKLPRLGAVGPVVATPLLVAFSRKVLQPEAVDDALLPELTQATRMFDSVLSRVCGMVPVLPAWLSRCQNR